MLTHNVVTPSPRRHDVTVTSERRCYDAVCLLGSYVNLRTIYGKIRFTSRYTFLGKMLEVVLCKCIILAEGTKRVENSYVTMLHIKTVSSLGYLPCSWDMKLTNKKKKWLNWQKHFTRMLHCATYSYPTILGRIQTVSGVQYFNSKFHFQEKFWMNLITLVYRICP